MVASFKKVPFLGTLHLEKTLYCRSTPEIFVCMDDRQQRYLCIAAKTPGKFLVGKVRIRHLLQMLRDERPLFDTIRRANIKGVITGLAGKYTFSLDIPESFWPACDRLLGLYSFDFGVQEYVEKLKACPECNHWPG